MTYGSTGNTASHPFVHYHCDCPDIKSTTQDHSQFNKEPGLLDDTSIISNNNSSILLSSPSPSNSTQLDRLDENTAYNTGRHLLSHHASNYLYPLSRLYFCEDCHEIRCPCCVQDEIISYYCPNCLFEVPTASVKSEKNRCARNCFQCPTCHNTLAVMASQEATSTSPANAGPYFLACNVCRWNSQEIGMTFEKPTSLALQLQKNEDALPDVQEFDNLKEHFEKHLKVNTPSLPSSFLSFSSSGAFNKMMGGGSGLSYDLQHSGSGSHSHQQQAQGRLDDITNYDSTVQVPDKEMATLDSLTSLRDMDRISALDQRYTQLHDQSYLMNQIHPQRIHLCIKRSKRCRTCRHILIKPEQKAQATRFKIKLVAMNYIPTITITKILAPTTIPSTSSQQQHQQQQQQQQQQSLSLNVGVATQFALKFINPLYEEMSVTLATPQPPRRKPAFDPSANDNNDEQHQTLPSVNGRVTILSPHFRINPYNETIEYDDEMYPLGNSSSNKSKSGKSASWASGIYEKRNNYTSVIVEVIPEKTGELKFPLLVTCNYKSDEDRMDVSSGDIDEEDMDMDSSMDGSRKANSSIRMDDDRTKSYSFWCVIGLGTVQDPSIPTSV